MKIDVNDIVKKVFDRVQAESESYQAIASDLGGAMAPLSRLRTKVEYIALLNLMKGSADFIFDVDKAIVTELDFDNKNGLLNILYNQGFDNEEAAVKGLLSDIERITDEVRGKGI
jgi:hypothetical protein